MRSPVRQTDGAAECGQPEPGVHPGAPGRPGGRGCRRHAAGAGRRGHHAAAGLRARPDRAGRPRALQITAVQFYRQRPQSKPPGQHNIKLLGHVQQGEAELLVRDYGQGIPEKELEKKSASPFTWWTSPAAARPGARGWALLCAREIARIHGARFSIDSRVGEGTLITPALAPGRRGTNRRGGAAMRDRQPARPMPPASAKPASAPLGPPAQRGPQAPVYRLEGGGFGGGYFAGREPGNPPLQPRPSPPPKPPWSNPPRCPCATPWGKRPMR